MTLAETWHDALKRANTLDPDAIALAITSTADNGLRATSYDRDGGRTTHAPCDDQGCPDGPFAHSHPVTSDPTGNAALRRRHDDVTELRNLDRASRQFVSASAVVLAFVCGDYPTSWRGVLRTNAQLMPGTVQAGLDVDDERILPSAIHRVDQAVTTIECIARAHMPRKPSEDERHWTSGLADEDCCSWHLEIEPRGHYRRLRTEGKNLCSDCVSLVLMADGARPPGWLLEAEVECMSKPRAWNAALGRWLDELGIQRESA